MARPRTLTHPPIVEALVDLRAAVPGHPEMFKALADELRDEFPTREEQQELRSTIEVKDGKLVPPQVDPPAFGGVRVASADRTVYVQFRPDGFTLNNLRVYMGGDRLIGEALRRWELLVARTKPQVVSRVALRYINRLELPLQSGDRLSRYLTAAPELPEGAPLHVSRSLSRVVGHDEQRRATAVVSQQLQRQKGRPVVAVDIDVYRSDEFPVDSVALRDVLASLRMLKNETFFSLLTDETLSLYE